MEWIVQTIVTTPEYRGWGWNVITISFLATIALTFGLQLPSLINQAMTIWKNRSAKGVEMLTFIAFFTYFTVFVVYAFATHSGAGMVNTSVLLIPQLFILAGIIRFNNLRTIDVFASAAGAALLLLAIFSENKESSYMIASLVVFVGLLLQPIAMIKTKTSANVALSFPLSFASVCTVWTLYGVAVSDQYIAGVSFVFMFEYLWIALLWFRYHVREKA